MKRVFSILFALALVLAFSLVATTPVGAATINVPGDQPTLQAAINFANPGDTILVAAGIYNVDAESWQPWGTCIHINKDNLHIKGAGSALTVLDARHTYSVLNAPGPTQLHCTVVWVQAQTCTIEGLTVKRGDYGIRANWNGPSTSLTLIDVVVDANYGNGIIFENNITTATFTNVVAKGSGDRGIYFSPVTAAGAVTLTNTSANNNGHAGFGCQGSIANLSITGGTFNNNTGGLFHHDFATWVGPYYGFGIELWNCVGSVTAVTAAGNGFLGPNTCGGLYGLEGGAGIVVKAGMKLPNNIVITCSDLVNNRNGLWIEDPDSVVHWGACGGWVGSVALQQSDIAGNTEYGVLNMLAFPAPGCPVPVVVTATSNWWNHATGPGPVGPGLGDKVSPQVLFAPWVTESYAASKSVTPTTGGTASFSASQGNIMGLQAVPTHFSHPVPILYGMFKFTICCFSGPVTLTVTLPGPVPVGSRWYKYQGGLWSSLPIGSDNGDNIITVTFTDGGPGDADGSPNGQITDDGGVGDPTPVGWETHPISKVRVLLPWIALFAAIAAGASLFVIRRRRAQS